VERRFTDEPVEGCWKSRSATSAFILGSATLARKGSSPGNGYRLPYRISLDLVGFTILCMTVRGDSERLAKKLAQRRAVKLRAFAMWSETGERLPYSLAVEVESSDNTHNATASVPNFGAHSPLGSGEWIAPWDMRWSVPTK
jgi:hypothetical protein